MKKFRYFIGDDNHDDYFEYEVSDEKLHKAIIDILLKYYSIGKNELEWFISNEDLYQYFEEKLKDELEDYFEEEAREEMYEQYIDSKSKYD